MAGSNNPNVGKGSRLIREGDNKQSQAHPRMEGRLLAPGPLPAADNLAIGGNLDAGAVSDQRPLDDHAPLVDEALRSIRERDKSDRMDHVDGAEILALRREAGRMAESASELAAGTVRLSKIKTRGLARDIEDTIRKRPLTSIAIAAVVAFALGATR